MKKLTKRVQAGGLWFDVPKGTTHIAIDKDGCVYGYTERPTVYESFWDTCTSASTEICIIELGLTDWNSCCWYVGDQVDGEAVERREWMARGAETVVSRLENGVVGADKYEGVCSSIKIGRVTIKEIRSGEVDL